MPLPIQELHSLLGVLADNEKIKVIVKEHVKGGVIAASFMIVGALGGPFSMFIGKYVLAVG